MKRHKNSMAFGLILTGMGMASPALAEVDHYSGAQCFEMWGANGVAHRADTSLYNPTAQGITVTCPLNIDDGNSRWYKKIWVDAFDASASTALECRIVSCNSTGACLLSDVLNTGISATGNRTIIFGDSSLRMTRANAIVCSMPAVAASGSFFIFRYGGEKN
jgi:hypothetical protein